jgi:hypothetical protein
MVELVPGISSTGGIGSWNFLDPGISFIWNGYGGLVPGISSIWNG